MRPWGNRGWKMEQKPDLYGAGAGSKAMIRTGTGRVSSRGRHDAKDQAQSNLHFNENAAIKLGSGKVGGGEWGATGRELNLNGLPAVEK